MGTITSIYPSFGEVLKKYRMQGGCKQSEIIKELKVSKTTYSNWENDINTPSLKQIRYLCNRFNIPAHELLGVPSPESLTPNKKKLLEIYDSLSVSGKSLLQTIAKDMAIAEADEHFKAITSSAFIMSDTEQKMSAGDGFPVLDDATLYSTPIFVRSTSENKDADLLMTVYGPSMEPTFHDGDRVYVKQISYVPDPGTVVFASFDNKAVIKRVGADRKLHSDNPEFPFSDKHVDVRVHGIVLGIAKDSDFFSKEDVNLLTDEFSDELKSYAKEHHIYGNE
ncbi:MAG: helix-turn-helix domain-containing protein [Clostridia bacterium]|nr:helix-turn-helix domain-containing protein [Clostridia bacterium]